MLWYDGTMAVPEFFFYTSLSKFTSILLSHGTEYLFVRKSTAGTELRAVIREYRNNEWH